MTASLRLDLHVHSRHSPDGRLALATIVEQLGYAGLNGFALTDHNTVAGHPELASLAREYPMYWFIPGVEVSTREGHLLAYGVHALPPIHRPLAETVEWIRAHGGISVLAHPFRWAHGVGRRVAARAAVDGVEAVNGHNAEIANARAELVAARRGLAATGGSDAHDRADVGRAYTEFPVETSSLDDLFAHLRARHTRGAGRPLSVAARIRLGVRTSLLRVSRGFRPI
ncbi:MAG TPA: CehA/McbA family metallohydrolase [Thermoplasmata archaeon]|nr:CehA/McbA family metallohydrolase [Thermoplasmata archaeon]